MYKRRVTVLASAILAALVLAAVAVPTASASSEPVRIAFTKSWAAPGVYTGTVSGDVTGTLTAVAVSEWQSGSVFHIVFDQIISAGQKSFVARTTGTFNAKTGAVVMNGTVTDGWLEGAQLHDEAQLVDPDAFTLEGVFTLFPATAGH